MKKFVSVLLIALLSCLIISVIISVNNPPASAPKPTLFDPIEAGVECEFAVRHNLKAPSTSEFGGEKVSRITGQPESYHYVEGWVDAQNSFGAMVRTHYSCVVVNHGNDNWVVEKLDF